MESFFKKNLTYVSNSYKIKNDKLGGLFAFLSNVDRL